MAPHRTGTIGARHPREAHGHPSRRLSAQCSRRNTMTPSTARAVTTSLQVISTSLWCIVLLPLVLCHPDHGSQPRRCNTPPAVSRRRIPRSAAHRWVSRLSRIHRCSVEAWGLPPRPCTPRARVSTPTLWRPTCGYGRDAADRGDVPRCPCPKLGKMPISWHSAGARRRRGQAPVLCQRATASRQSDNLSQRGASRPINAADGTPSHECAMPPLAMVGLSGCLAAQTCHWHSSCCA
jgi:hypothetical protein